MSVKIWHDSGLHVKPTSGSVECLQDQEMQVVLYTMQHKGSLNIVPEDYDVTSTLILLEGGLKVYSQGETFELYTHDALMLTNIKKSYYVEAVGFTKVMAVTSEANQDSQEDEAVMSMLADVEEKDVYTLGHSRRVSLYSKRLALSYESTYNVIALSAAGCMHDIGKINTPIEILQKPGNLTKEEYDIVKCHSSDAYYILRDRLGERVARAARQHHERLDGSGYPDGLRGDEISMDARILAIADVFDAMTCKRIYNEPTPPLEVVKYLEESPNQYDPVIVSILRRKVENGEMDDILTAFVHTSFPPTERL